MRWNNSTKRLFLQKYIKTRSQRAKQELLADYMIDRDLIDTWAYAYALVDMGMKVLNRNDV